jgi:large subunit ribosomal protein L23Ae
MDKGKQVQNAQKAGRVAKRSQKQRKNKIYKRVRFFRPRTQTLASKPKYERGTQVFGLTPKFDKFKVLNFPLTTEKVMKKMEDENTMAFIVHNRANKQQIKAAFSELYGAKIRAVRTLVTPLGKKKAYIRLAPESDALGVASKMGII